MMLSAKDKSLVPQGTLSSYSFILLGTFHIRMEFSLSSFVIAVTLIPGHGLTHSRDFINIGHV